MLIETAPEVYTGKDAAVDIDGAIGNWIDYKVEVTTEKEKCKPAAQTKMRQCTISKHCKITLNGYRGGSETFNSLAHVDKDVDSVTLTDPPPGFEEFDKWRITDANMEAPTGPGKYTLTLEQGMVGTSTYVAPV